MPKPCSVCTHPSREQIDRALMSGVPYRTLAAQYDLSASALCRHMRHLARYRENLVKQEDHRHNLAMLDKIDLLTFRLDRLFNEAQHRNSLRVALESVKEYARLLDLMQRFRR